MRRAVNLALSFYWIAAFGLLALAAVAAGDRGVGEVLSMLAAGSSTAVATASKPFISAVVAVVLMLAALLFTWLLIVELADGDDGDDTADPHRAAIAGGVAALAVLTAVAMMNRVGSASGTLALQIAALLATYLVFLRNAAKATADASSEGPTAHAMAADAARHYEMNRLGERLLAAGGAV